MKETKANVLWRRLDAPGHDACRLLRTGSGWRLEGVAVFRRRVLAALAYSVDCDASWRTRGGRVRGWSGARSVDLVIRTRGASGFEMNGRIVRGLEACDDLDFGFSPATNLIALRRIRLRVGERREVRSARLDEAVTKLQRLDQWYERTSPAGYRYEAPRFGYSTTLVVGRSGFVSDYPPLWKEAPPRRRA
jgi:uncharacterized protein